MNPFKDRFDPTFARLFEVITVGFVEISYCSEAGLELA